jgi:uncharacterized protein YdcH (DUF465 family)
MSLQHFKSLVQKFSQIERKIEKEQSRRHPDWVILSYLKKMRLTLKDRLQRQMKTSDKSPDKSMSDALILLNKATRKSLKGA